MEKYRIALVGAGNLIGQEIIRILEERRFPIADMNLCGIDDTVGRTTYFQNRPQIIKPTNLDSFRDMDIAIFVAGDETTRRYANYAEQAGSIIIDNSTIYRLEPDVPLVVPEVNIESLKKHRGIIASPGCSSVLLNVVIYPLHKISPIKKVVVSTYQSTSGLGQAAMDELTVQTRQMLAGETPRPNVFPHEIGFNVLPQVDVFLDNGYTREEWQILEETRKILHNKDILVSATCARVPTLKGHCQAVTIEFSDEINAEMAEDALARAPGVRVVDDTDINLYPHPRMAAGTDQVLVGRLRQDAFNLKGLAVWIVADNVRKGNALNVVQIAEELTKRGWLRTRGRK